jgi:hypothetical protein
VICCVGCQRRERFTIVGSCPVAIGTPDRAYPEPPLDPSDEELARDWTLSAEYGRDNANRHRFAIQLCALRALGRFVDDVSQVPVRITNHLGHQLGLPQLLFLVDHDRPATATEHAQHIRDYLGYRPFDAAAEEREVAGQLRDVSCGEMLAQVPAEPTAERWFGPAGLGVAAAAARKFTVATPQRGGLA